MSYELDFSINPFIKKKEPKYYYDFGTGIKVPIEDKKDSTQTTPTQTAKSTNQNKESDDAFLQGFNYDRDERDAGVRNAYAERMKNKAEREMRVDAFLEGFNSASEYSTLPKEPRNATLKDLTINSFQKGYFNNRYGEEAYNRLIGKENNAEKYRKILEEEKYQFKPDNWFEEEVSDAFSGIAEMVYPVTRPQVWNRAVQGAGMGLGWAIGAGQAGPQVATPEEVVTVPAAVVAGGGVGFSVGTAENAFKVETGKMYSEMVENGISPKVAENIAAGVGAINASLELVPADDLLKAYKILDDSKVKKDVIKRIEEELIKRGFDDAKSTIQERVRNGGIGLGKLIGR